MKSMEERVAILRRTAEKLRQRKMEFSAWLVVETGKNWAEADADTAEAIDFLEYYAFQAMKLTTAEPSIQYPGEKNTLVYLSLGVGAVIATGNTVVLKPSPLAPTIAAQFHALLLECGLSANVVMLVQGGPDFGDALVQHPDVKFIAFTGSKKIGLHIHSKAASVHAGQIAIKRTILELGGKDDRSRIQVRSRNIEMRPR
jgi:1-pyrroline-5-carboxylate dehydrogenase